MEKSNQLMRNISICDIILNYLSYFKHFNIFKKMKTYLIYREVYRNSISVLMNVSMRNFPIDAVLRNGNHMVLHNIMEAQSPCGRNILGGRHEGIKYDIPNDKVILSAIPFGVDDTVTIYGGITNGDIVGIFVDKIYGQLPVKDRTVIDVGANIADSAIFFSLSGAKKIIGIEPVPKNYELAQKNIKLNNLFNNISVILAGCYNNTGEINIDPSYSNGAYSTLNDFEAGSKIDLITLKDILEEYTHPSDDYIILKMDCEGCEYESILSADKNTLQKFNHIMIEYHYGYKNLRDKLIESGFIVSVTRPRIEYWSPEFSDQKYKFAVGNIIAKRH